MRLPIGLLALVLALAGCLTPAVDTAHDPTPEVVDLAAIGAALAVDHNHYDVALHEPVSVGVDDVRWGTASLDGRPLGKYVELDQANGLVAVTAYDDDGGTFALLDASALPEIRVLSTARDPGAQGDVKLDRDLPLLYHAHPPAGIGFTIWDVSDPTSPVRVGEARGAGCHMVHPQTLNGVPHVWCSTLPGAELYRIQTLPDGSRMGVPVGSAIVQQDPETQRFLTYYEELSPLLPVGPIIYSVPHDMTAQHDPLDATRPLLVVAYELHGIRVFDLTAPSAPVEIARWRGEGLEGEMHRIHTAQLVEIGDRRIAFAATETWHGVTPETYIVDFTDWEAPKLLAVWTPPGIDSDGAGQLKFSAHNFQVVGTRLYAANFHAGAWVVDVADPANPVTIALRTPVHAHDETGDLIEPLDHNVLGVLDVVVVNGYAILAERASGVEVVAFSGDPHGDPTWASTA